jgi:hypothetical protein
LINQPPYDDNILERGDEGGAIWFAIAQASGRAAWEARARRKMSPPHRWSMMPGDQQTNLFFKNIGLSYFIISRGDWGRVFAGPTSYFKTIFSVILSEAMDLNSL